MRAQRRALRWCLAATTRPGGRCGRKLSVSSNLKEASTPLILVIHAGVHVVVFLWADGSERTLLFGRQEERYVSTVQDWLWLVCMSGMERQSGLIVRLEPQAQAFVQRTQQRHSRGAASGARCRTAKPWLAGAD